MSSPTPIQTRTGSTRGWSTLTLAVVVFLAMVWANGHYLFRAELYEHGDLAANSLQVRRAKGFRELYGQYSRWGFHHPGPAWFYVAAAGEAVFHDALGLVPTPYNGQLLGTAATLAFFFAAAVGTAARGVRSRWFLPLALTFATLHFAAAIGWMVFLWNWPPCLLVLPFLCLLVAAASVGAGRGEDLPLLVLAGGFLLHSHVAQPMFVLPLGFLAYAGLVWAGRGAHFQDGVMVWPWRSFPRAHGLALGLAVLFALPVLIDLTRGSESNVARILAHRRAHAGERHPALDSVNYLLRFGVYKPYLRGEELYRGGATPAETVRFVTAHGGLFALWLGAGLVPAAAWAWGRRQRARDADRGIPATGTVAARGRFGVWLGACWALGVGLTLGWGVIQDGALFYFNGWFNHALFFVLALGAAAAGSVALERLTARLPARVSATLASALFLVPAALFAQRAERFRGQYADDETSRLMARGVDAALAAQPGETRRRFLTFTSPDWEAAVGVALQLERRGVPWRVPPGSGLIFGEEHSPDSPLAGLPLEGAATPFRVWRVAFPAAALGVLAPSARPLVLGCALATDSPEVDPAAGNAEITFTGGSESFAAHTLFGWATPDPDASYTWSVGATGTLCFRPRSVLAGSTVELSFDFFPALDPVKRPAQRLEVRFNGVDLGTWRVGAAEAGAPVRVTIPAAVWNAHPDALLLLGFPDAVSPAELGHGGDTRPLAFGFRRLTFRLVGTPAS